MYSFCQLMTASMPTFIGRNSTAIRPTHDCFYANLGHIMTAFMPTIGQIVWLQKVNLSLLFCQLYLTSWWYHCLHANSSWIIYLLWTHLLILNHLAGLLDTNSNDHTASDKNSLLPDHVLNRKVDEFCGESVHQDFESATEKNYSTGSYWMQYWKHWESVFG